MRKNFGGLNRTLCFHFKPWLLMIELGMISDDFPSLVLLVSFFHFDHINLSDLKTRSVSNFHVKDR